MHGAPFRPTIAFAYERELAGCSRESLIGVLPPSAIPPEWLAERRDALGSLEEQENAAAAKRRAQEALDELEALNGGAS